MHTAYSTIQTNVWKELESVSSYRGWNWKWKKNITRYVHI